MKGLLVIAVDGLDWALLLAEQAAGRLPQRLSFPPPAAASAAARWTSFACGADPVQHCVAQDQIVCPDGLRLAPPAAADLAGHAASAARLAGRPGRPCGRLASDA